MLQINPSEFLRLSRLINNSLDTIDENMKLLRKEANKQVDSPEMKELTLLITTIKNSTDFITKIIDEFEEATGEDINKLVSSKYQDKYYKDKILKHYAEIMCGDRNNAKLETLQMCYSDDEELSKYCQRQNFINNYSSYLKGFDASKFGLDKETIERELLYIYDKRGANEAYSVMRALANNCPSNYFEYDFNPKSQMHPNEYYDYNKKTIGNYITNSEIISINGYKYEFAQVLPKDCTNLERLAYNFAKANTINTMRTLPNKFLDYCTRGNSNAIILTCNTDAMNNGGSWSGYYKSSSLFSSNSNMVIIDARGTFNYNDYYTQNTVIHELGHKFDDMMGNKSFIDKLFGRVNYTGTHSEWQNAYKKYKDVLASINEGGYESYPNVNEFFSDANVAYYKNPETLRTLCPEAYNLISNMIGGEYGYSYSEKIANILAV